MWKLTLLVIVLLVRSESAEIPVKVQDENISNILQVSTTTMGSSSTAASIPLEELPVEMSSAKPTMESPLPTAQPAEEESTSSSRPQVIYDQRQEGKYNIRADLENFMIVVIPPNPTAGVNLLDLLTSSGLKRSNTKKSTKRHKYPDLAKYGKPSKGNFFHLDKHASSSLEGSPSRLSEFIEGRTPYRVDISSAENDFESVHPESQVDVLPPPYPFVHLMKPYHLEAEPLLPPHPSVVPIVGQGKFMELLNRFGGEGRVARTIRDPSSGDLNNNYVFSVGRTVFSENEPISRSFDDKMLTSSQNDRVAILDNADSFYRTKAANVEDQVSGNWELKLIGAMEQCGPDRKRDSYGICQYMPEIV